MPLRDQFRPLAFLSPLYKFIKLRFLPMLSEYLEYNKDKN